MKVSLISWPYVVPDKLLKACGDDFKSIRNSVQDNESNLYHFQGDNTDLFMVIRSEGSEMVVVCVGGEGIKEAGQYLIENAQKLGFTSIRYHAKNPAVHRLYSGYGFGGEEVERVYKIALGGK
jgi:hypothetical protein